MIKIEHLNFSFLDKRILNNINISFSKGEIVGIIGPNGSGKTTLLKCIAGIYNTDKQIRIDDKFVEEYDYKKKAKLITMMNQNNSMIFDFNCYDIVSMARYSYLDGFSKLSENDHKIIETQMEFTKTLRYKNRTFTKLSGGEKQRVMFAKTLAQQSEYMLFDEPTSAQDIKNENFVFRKLNELSKQFCVVVSVHNLRLAIKYCDRLILLSNGEVIANGPVKDVITQKNLKSAYGVDNSVYFNSKTNMIDYFVT